MISVQFFVLLTLGLSASAFKISHPANKYEKRLANCPRTILPKGYGPVPEPDTPEAFLEYRDFVKIAVAAEAPPGFTRIFSNAKAAIESPEYLTYYELKSYDVSACADYCDNIEKCETFNVFFERSLQSTRTTTAKTLHQRLLSNALFLALPLSILVSATTGNTRRTFTSSLPVRMGISATTRTLPATGPKSLATPPSGRQPTARAHIRTWATRPTMSLHTA